MLSPRLGVGNTKIKKAESKVYVKDTQSRKYYGKTEAEETAFHRAMTLDWS